MKKYEFDRRLLVAENLVGPPCHKADAKNTLPLKIWDYISKGSSPCYLARYAGMFAEHVSHNRNCFHGVCLKHMVKSLTYFCMPPPPRPKPCSPATPRHKTRPNKRHDAFGGFLLGAEAKEPQHAPDRVRQNKTVEGGLGSCRLRIVTLFGGWFEGTPKSQTQMRSAHQKQNQVALFFFFLGGGWASLV